MLSALLHNNFVHSSTAVQCIATSYPVSVYQQAQHSISCKVVHMYSCIVFMEIYATITVLALIAIKVPECGQLTD